MGKLQDLTGIRYGKLVVTGFAGRIEGRTYWECRCDCGKTCTVWASNLKNGRTQSCGCLQKERAAEVKTTHGKRHDKIYYTWDNMNQRCNNPNHPQYKDYGGRGITVCERWLVFENFYEDVSQMEHYGEQGYSLDRINVNGNYEPENVRWATKKDQCRNRRNNIIVEYEDETMTLTEAAEKSGINYKTLKKRYYRGDRGERLFRPIERR